MKLTASIKAIIKVKETDSHADVHDKVIEKLILICDEWLKGECSPKIEFKYELNDEEIATLPKELLN